MRTLLTVLAALATIVLVAVLGYQGSLALNAEQYRSEPESAVIAAAIIAAFVTVIAIVSSAFAGFVAEQRGWRLVYLVGTVGFLAWWAFSAFASGEGSSTREDLWFALLTVLAIWLPVATRWVVSRIGARGDAPVEADVPAEAPPA